MAAGSNSLLRLWRDRVFTAAVFFFVAIIALTTIHLVGRRAEVRL